MHSIKTEVKNSIPAENLMANLQSNQSSMKRKAVKEEPTTVDSTSHSPVKMIKTEQDIIATVSSALKENSPCEETNCKPLQPANKTTTDFDWSLHHNFWNSKSTDSNACPKCGEFAGAIDPVRRAHYIRYHYDIYYSVIGQRTKEVWISRKLGGRPERNPRARVCLNCPQQKGNRRFFDGRIKLLKHIEKEHSEAFTKLQEEYAELSTEAKPDDAALNDMLTAITRPQEPLPVQKPKEEPKEVENQNRKKLRPKRKETIMYHGPLTMFNSLPNEQSLPTPQPIPQPPPASLEQLNIIPQLLPQFPLMPFDFHQPLNFLMPFSIIPQFTQPFMFNPLLFNAMPNLYAQPNTFLPQQPTVIDLTAD